MVLVPKTWATMVQLANIDTIGWLSHKKSPVGRLRQSLELPKYRDPGHSLGSRLPRSDGSQFAFLDRLSCREYPNPRFSLTQAKSYNYRGAPRRELLFLITCPIWMGFVNVDTKVVELTN